MPHLVEEFECPKDASRKILLNLRDDDIYIMREPTHTELQAVLESFEAEVVTAFWAKAILNESPYKSGLPYGLACNAVGRNAVEWTVVYEKLTGKQPRSVVSASAFCRAQSLKHLADALRELQPKSVAQAESVLAAGGLAILKTPSVLQIASTTPDFKQFASVLWGMAQKTGKGQRTAVNLLVRMRSEGWVLLPRNIVPIIGAIVRGLHAKGLGWDKLPEYYLGSGLVSLFEQLAPEEGVSRNDKLICTRKRRHVQLCSSMQTLEDLSLPLLRDLLGRTGDSQAGADVAVSRQLRKRWSEVAIANGPGALQRRAKNDHRRALEGRAPQNRILELETWVRFLVKECERFTGGQLDPVYKAFGAWLTWLGTFESIPQPMEIKREMIVSDIPAEGNTFTGFLERRGYKNTRDRNLPLSKMHKFFERMRIEEVAKGRTFLNPISLEFDLFKASPGEDPGRTNKERVPDKVMDELKAMLVVDKGNGRFGWGEKVAELTRLKGPFGVEIDDFFGEFCPILPAIIYLLLEYPLRTHHVRWLDSGDFDEFLFDFASRRFVRNPNGLKNRGYGMIQPDDEERFAGGAKNLLFQVAVNKVELQQRHKSYFTIPYLEPATMWVLQQVVEWQRRHGPKAFLVKELHEPGLWQRRNQKMATFYPALCPLFRYPGKHRGEAFPPSHQQIGYFWGKLCHEWDLEHPEGLRPCGAGAPKRMARSRDRTVGDKAYGVEWVGTFGLHCLRVANVSILLDAGMPLALVAAIAGHKTIVMTLRYHREDVGNLRRSVREARDKRGKLAELQAMDRLLEEYQNYEDYLVSTKQGFAALRNAQAKGNIVISLSGICPGTTCDRGLGDEYRSTCGSDVPGSRCALCQFRVYGPPFLPGLVLEANTLLMDLQSKAKHFSEQRQAAKKLEDDGHEKEADLIRGELDLLDRETELDMKVLFRLDEMIWESAEKANAAPTEASGKRGFALMVPADGHEKVVSRLELATEFDLLKAIAEDAAIMNATRHIAPTTAIRRLKDRLLGCLRRNGFEPYLLDLEEPVVNEATLQLARLLKLAVTNSDTRESVLDGKLPIGSVPGLEKGITKLMCDAGMPVLENAKRKMLLPGHLGNAKKKEATKTVVAKHEHNSRLQTLS